MHKGDHYLEINRLLQDFPGTIGIVIREIGGELAFDFNPQQVFPAASLIKLLILLAYYRRVEGGTLKPSQQVALSADQFVGGTGILQDLTPGCRLTLQDLATLMIVVSDNTATNMLIDRLGIEQINEVGRAYGLQDTMLQRKMFDWEAREKGCDNFTSPADIARLLDASLTTEFLSGTSKASLLAILKKQRLNNKLPAQTPPPASWAHKTGEMNGVEHDAGILTLAGRQVIVAVLTADLKDNEDGRRVIAEIGRIVYHQLLAPTQPLTF